MTNTRNRRGLLASLLAAFFLAGFLPATVASAADGPQFTVSPASGRPGEPIRVTSVDLCPPMPGDLGDMPYQDVVLSFVDSAGVSSGDRNLGGIGEGPWDAQVFFPSPTFDSSNLTPEPALGMGSLHIRCVLSNGVVSQEYAPQPFNVTGRAHRFTVSTSVEPGGTVHVESIDPCPQPQDRVNLSVSNGQYANNLNVTPGPNGQWSADIKAAFEEMDGTWTPFQSGPISLSANCMADATAQMSFVYASAVSTVTGSTGPTCKDALFIAATGSGEHYDGDANLTVSPTLRKVYNGFSAVYPTDKSLGIKVLDYPALPVDTLLEQVDGVNWSSAKRILSHNLPTYLGGKNVGVQALYDTMVAAKAACPNQALVLTGYSQGAMVVHQLLQGMAQTSDPVQSAIKAVVLIADPMRVPNSDVIDFGDAPLDSKGLCKLGPNFVDGCASGGVRDIPNRYKKMTTAVCEHYDLVCDTSSVIADMWPLGPDAAQTGATVHTLYAATPETKTAGKRAARQVLNGS